LASFGVSYTIVAFFPVILFYFFSKRKQIIFPRTYILLIAYFVLLAVSSIISTLINSVSINIIGLFAAFRLLVLVLLATNVSLYDEEYIVQLLFCLVLVNFIVSIIQMLIPSSVHLFYMLYWKPSMTPLKDALELGRFSRAMGTFGTPTILGALSLLTFSIFFFKLVYLKVNFKYLTGLLMSVGTGLMALSKIFVIGVPIVLFGALITYLLTKKNFVFRIKLNWKVIAIIILIPCVAMVVINLLNGLSMPVEWYLNYALKPFEAFSTRYSSTNGNLIPVLNFIGDHFLIGVGETVVGNIFLGDSSYIVILYSTGIIGLFLFVFIWVVIMYTGLLRGRKSYTHLFTLFVLLLIFTGANIHAAPLGILAFIYAAYPLSVLDKSLVLRISKHENDYI